MGNLVSKCQFKLAGRTEMNMIIGLENWSDLFMRLGWTLIFYAFGGESDIGKRD